METQKRRSAESLQSTQQKSMRWLFVSFFLMACGGAPGAAHEIADSEKPNTPALRSAGAESSEGCREGAVHDCRVELPEHNGVKSCYAGSQVCVNGSWNACDEARGAATMEVQTFVAKCASDELPEWTKLAYAIDLPTNESGSSSVRIVALENSDDLRGNVLVDTKTTQDACVDGACSQKLTAVKRESMTFAVHRYATPDNAASPKVRALDANYVCTK